MVLDGTEFLVLVNGNQLVPDLGVQYLVVLKGADGAFVPGGIGSSNQSSSHQNLTTIPAKSILGTQRSGQAVSEFFCGRAGGQVIHAETIARECAEDVPVMQLDSWC